MNDHIENEPQPVEHEPQLDQAWQACFDQLTQMRQSIEAVVVGQSDLVEHTLAATLACGHLLIEGVPGLGKTLLVRALAATFSGQSARIQFTPDLMPSDITGHALFDMQSNQFKIRKGPVFTNLLLADEINRAPAKTQAALLEVMQEQQVTIEGQPMSVPRPFMTFATQNPIEQEGTYPLPEAETDRFMMKVTVSFPDEAHERKIVEMLTMPQSNTDLLDTVEPVINTEQILQLQQQCQQVTVDPEVLSYVVNIVRATRNWPGIVRGAGPRGSIYLTQAAKAMAMLSSRTFVTPDDVKALALPVLRHRILLSAELEIEGRTIDSVITTLLNEVEAPRK